MVQTGNGRRIAIKVRKQLEGKAALFTFQGCKKVIQDRVSFKYELDFASVM